MRPTSGAFEPVEPLVGPAFTHVRLPAAAGAARLKLVGELDLVTADRARAAVARAQGESRVLICDLREVSFIDLTGLRVLLDAAAHAEQSERRLVLANSPPILPRMLGILGLQDAFEVRAEPLTTGHSCTATRPHVG